MSGEWRSDDAYGTIHCIEMILNGAALSVLRMEHRGSRMRKCEGERC